MASAVLPSRNDAYFGERKVYRRKYPNYPNPPNPNKNQIHEPSKKPHFPPVHPVIKETTHGRFITFKISAYTPRELKTLKKRLLSELEQVRALETRLDTLSRPVPVPMKSRKGVNAKRVCLDPAVTSMVKRCGQILGKIMKHKNGWVFNKPVDVEGLGLFDYYEIIKKPMDLGTVKKNLEKGVYKSGAEFASDVRLTFGNAMSYNPREHDVFVMAKELLGKFNELYAAAFENERVGLDVKAKAKGNKRGMSFEEKAKLGREIEGLPGEKMMELFEIVRRKGFFAQDGDEIELDMEAMDNETLCELRRFVLNYKKIVNKIKRQGFVAQINHNPPALIQNQNNLVGVSELGIKSGVVEEEVDIGEEIPVGNYPSVEIEKDVDVCDAGRSSSSGGSSSSDSSSSDSDSGSSSGSDSKVRAPFVGSNQVET